MLLGSARPAVTGREGGRARVPLQQTVGPIDDGPVEAPFPASPAEKQHGLVISDDKYENRYFE